MLLAFNWSIVGTVLLLIAVILLIVMAVLYFLGRRMQGQQAEQQAMIEANTMEASILIIDKKKMSIKDAVKAGLPTQVQENTPFYLRFSKLPIVKAKVGPRMVAMIADPSVFDLLPLKREVKVAVSGLYIRSIKSVRGGTVPVQPKKKGFWAGLREKAQEAVRKDQAKK
ncbi:hypothetical protein HW273_08845 [Oribacterium sp. oral taxon 102]|uniref:hypothetical protein n=1 Tax=Oribacterium sp. oral taxon 102 TaxID=671214 RepID=UPI0015C0C0DE|nr:hypothetical protein [Oribacterium sp. oral taxon 102]NWO22005.1 hypothetical protein [Oribacterium sp. oral taxon 102]